jgi:ubiquinone/menaquinone biosynthesis C-methylase UbiE
MAKHVCPVWVGYLLASPLRKLLQNPRTILGPYVSEGMIVLDIGCAMGFFSLPLAEMVGPGGRVICVDVQARMIESLARRARKAGLLDRIESRVCRAGSLGAGDLGDQIDFALASAVVHEVPDPAGLFTETYRVMKPGGRFLVLEPPGHVSKKEFETTVLTAEQAGFNVIDHPRIAHSRAVLLDK